MTQQQIIVLVSERSLVVCYSVSHLCEELWSFLASCASDLQYERHKFFKIFYLKYTESWLETFNFKYTKEFLRYFILALNVFWINKLDLFLGLWAFATFIVFAWNRSARADRKEYILHWHKTTASAATTAATATAAQGCYKPCQCTQDWTGSWAEEEGGAGSSCSRKVKHFVSSLML